MLPNFEYFEPTNCEELYKILEDCSSKEVRLLAGGTDLLPIMRAGRLHVDTLVDLSLLGLNEIKEVEGSIHIGALVTFRQIILNDLMNTKLPVLVETAKAVGAVQTRSLATIGGNICSAVPSCDSAPILIALGAKLLLRSKAGQRIIPIDEFFIGPRKTALNSGEFLQEIIIPPAKENERFSFMKLGRRKALTLAIVNGASMVEIDNNNEVMDCKIVLGAVGPTPIRAVESEKFLRGKRASEENIKEAARIASEEILPISDVRASKEYRKKLGMVIVKRTIEQCIQ